MRTRTLLCRRRKGITSIMEIVVCVSISAMLLTMLIAMITHVGLWAGNAEAAIHTERDMDRFLWMFVSDVKSSEDEICQGTSLALVKDGSATEYRIETVGESFALYRDEELLLTGIRRYEFNTPTASVVRIYLIMNDGQEIELFARR